MHDRAIEIGVVAVLVVVAVALAVGAGSGGDADAASTDGPFPTETPTDSASGTDSGASDAGTADTGPSFAFEVDRVESCGETCRDVTTTLTSEGAPATDVTVSTRIYVGNGTDGDVAWEGSEPVGDLGTDESYTGTERVELSITDAYAIQQAGGWITVRTTIQSDERTVTTTERRNVT